MAHRLRTATGPEERGRLESLVKNFRQREQAYDRALRRLDHTTWFVEALDQLDYSSRVSRFSLRVGTPYEASTSRVIDMLAHLAKEHPHVLEIPAPQVLLEEFGQNARIFTLNYWLEIRLDIDPSQVASELRFAIELKFAEAGLKVLPAA